MKGLLSYSFSKSGTKGPFTIGISELGLTLYYFKLKKFFLKKKERKRDRKREREREK